MTRIAASIVVALTILGQLAPARAQNAPAVHVRGIGEGADCWILLHPFGASGRFWERRAPLLAQAHNVRVYFPDLPSHGRSRLVARFDYDQAAEQVRRALRRDCPRAALIVGASSGGIVAMKLGARLRVPVAAVGVGWSFSPANVAALRGQAQEEGANAYLATFAEQGEPQISRLRRHFADLAAFGTAPLFSRGEARGLAGRLLVLWGEADDFFGRSSVDALVAAVPGARLETFPGAGHLEPFAPANAERTWRQIGEHTVAGRRASD
jgi:pimeloyl-ACP methyl ester carboxylesterase